MYKYGIISTASIVERFVEGIRQSNEGEVYAIASRDKQKAKHKAQSLNIPVYYDCYEDLYKDENIDIIYIPAMNALHYKCAKEALKHHKHILVEKPFTLHEKDAVELFELAKKENCFIMEVQKSVFLPITQMVKEHLEDIGKISYIDLQAGFPSRFEYDHWMYDLNQGGGALYGSATYTLEYIHYLLNALPNKLTGEYIPCMTGSDEICHFTYHISDILVSSTIAMNIQLDNRCIIYGTNGKIEIDHYWRSHQMKVTIYNQDEVVYEDDGTNEFKYEINHVHDCLNKGLLNSPVMTPYITTQTVKLVEDLYNSWTKRNG